MFNQNKNISKNNTTNSNSCSHTRYSVFHIPRKKKSVIFLRAPYKNKLARLNILNLEFTNIVSFKLGEVVQTTDFSRINVLGNYLFDTHKLKHTKTKIKFYTSNNKNFQLIDFN